MSPVVVREYYFVRLGLSVILPSSANGPMQMAPCGVVMTYIFLFLVAKIFTFVRISLYHWLDTIAAPIWSRRMGPRVLTTGVGLEILPSSDTCTKASSSTIFVFVYTGINVGLVVWKFTLCVRTLSYCILLVGCLNAVRKNNGFTAVSMINYDFPFCSGLCCSPLRALLLPKPFHIRQLVACEFICLWDMFISLVVCASIFSLFYRRDQLLFDSLLVGLLFVQL